MIVILSFSNQNLYKLYNSIELNILILILLFYFIILIYLFIIHLFLYIYFLFTHLFHCFISLNFDWVKRHFWPNSNVGFAIGVGVVHGVVEGS